MKNFKYLGIVFVFSFIFLVIANPVKADLASTKALYLARIDDKQAAVQAQIDRISGLSYINATAKTQLTNNFNSYNTNYLVDLEKQINASSTEDQVIDLINSGWQLPYMVLVKSMFSYANANVVAGNIQTAYQLINDTRTFVDNYTTDVKYNVALSENNKKFALKLNFIKGAYAQKGKPIDGVCGTADKHIYTYVDTTWGGFSQCSVGNPSNTSFPAAGATANWTCPGINGGTTASCSSSRNTCGNAITELGEDCDDGNITNGTAGDTCYNDCTKRYLDAGDTTSLDNALANLDDYESAVADSLDANLSGMDTLLVNIYNVYSQAITENEKLVLMTGYEQSLEAFYTNTQSVNSNIVTEVVNILAL